MGHALDKRAKDGMLETQLQELDVQLALQRPSPHHGCMVSFINREVSQIGALS